MAAPEKFDFAEFVIGLKASPPENRRDKVQQECWRARDLTIRESGAKFQQQLYVGRLERLARHLKGIDVSRELTPSEVQAYALLLDTPAPAAPAVQPPPAPAAPQGKDRRTSRRIAMKTRARVRRQSNQEGEVVEPVNVSKGGISFLSRKRFELHESVFVTMHYQPGAAEMETRSQIVRAAPTDTGDFSYGVKFLE